MDENKEKDWSASFAIALLDNAMITCMGTAVCVGLIMWSLIVLLVGVLIMLPVAGAEMFGVAGGVGAVVIDVLLLVIVKLALGRRK